MQKNREISYPIQRVEIWSGGCGGGGTGRGGKGLKLEYNIILFHNALYNEKEASIKTNISAQVMLSEGLEKHSLRAKKFQIFLGEHASRAPPPIDG